MTNPAQWPGGLAYVGIFLAAAVEGEVVLVAAAILAGLGQLNSWGVLLAGALGGSAGDQFYFYALRTCAWKWLSRITSRVPRQQLAMRRIHRHSTAMILACRFLPGLRIAIPAACACAGISAVRFSTLSLIGSFAWAAAIVFVISHTGSLSIALNGRWAPLLPALLILVFVYWLGRRSKNYLERPAEMDNLAG